MRARGPLWPRVREFFAGFVGSVRGGPAVPAAAVAVILVVALGIGIIARSGVHFGAGGASNASSRAPAEAVAGSRYAGTFSPLPVPAAAATNAPPKAANPSIDTGGAIANPNAYAGPIN